MSHPQTEYLSPLPRQHRSVFFYLLFLVFILVVPVIVFYASGYRYTIGAEESRVQMTGGMYIGTLEDDSVIEINGSPVQHTRFFRRATYVQGLNGGMHEVAVYGDGLQTWSKVLPVYPQMVTEFNTFTLPVNSQMRPITPLQTSSGEMVFHGYDAPTSTPFAFASSTVPLVYSTSSTPLPYRSNPEYEFLSELFTQERMIRPEPPHRIEQEPAFRFSSQVAEDDSLVDTDVIQATSTVRQGNVRLEWHDEEVFAVFDGPFRTIPHYFCLPEASASTTAAHYGTHVAEAVTVATTTTTTTLRQRGTWYSQVCREEIRIDRMGQAVEYFDFVPGVTDLVLLHLEDGLYVTEIDDRSWQNHQVLYPRGDIYVMVHNGQILIQDGNYFAELFITRQD